jgi:hypothetical protein
MSGRFSKTRTLTVAGGDEDVRKRVGDNKDCLGEQSKEETNVSQSHPFTADQDRSS